MEFRNKYKVPIFLEESLSFGVLGSTGKGAAEHFNVSVCYITSLVLLFLTLLLVA